MVCNKKRVYRLMKQHGLLVSKNTRLLAKRCSQKPKPKATRPNQFFGIDMTKVMVENFGWIYVVIVLDWFTKKVVGHYAGMQSKSSHWQLALDQALQRQFPQGVREADLKLISDNGCQPTSVAFMQNCRDLRIEQIFTSYNNPKGNADTERFMRTMKEDCLWLKNWNDPQILIAELNRWIEVDYNLNYCHSSLGGYSPIEAEILADKNQAKTLVYSHLLT